MKEPVKEENKNKQSLSSEEIMQFFLVHLNKIYCAKLHLAERLPELADQADFGDLEKAIHETRDDIVKQIARIEEIYILLNAEPVINNCDTVIDFVEEGYSAIYEQSFNSKTRDLSILFYMSLIESVEMASFKILQLVSIEFSNMQIKQLLQENFDESKADRELFTQIASKYINNI